MPCLNSAHKSCNLQITRVNVLQEKEKKDGQFLDLPLTKSGMESDQKAAARLLACAPGRKHRAEIQPYTHMQTSHFADVEIPKEKNSSGPWTNQTMKGKPLPCLVSLVSVHSPDFCSVSEGFSWLSGKLSWKSDICMDSFSDRCLILSMISD